MDKPRYIVAGGLIDGTGAPVRRHIFLTVEDGRITAMGQAAALSAPDQAAIDDLRHCIVVPALVDCSLSLDQSPSVGGKEADATQQAVLVARHISYCHSHGVLGVAAHRIGSNRLEAVPQAIIDIRLAGRDFIRINYSGDIAEETPSQPPPPDELDRILQHRGEKKVVMVANGEKEVAAALAAGCDALEQGYAMGEENLRRMAEHGVLWIPSVLRAKNGLDSSASGGSVCCRFSQRYVAPGQALPGAEAFWKKMLHDQLAQLRLARELGVQTALGTGAGSTGILHGEAMVEEMKLFMTAGYSLEEAICCASQTPARFFGLERLGALSVGRPATFLVTRGSVKQLPRKLSYLESIYIDGAPSAGYQKNPVKPAP